MAEVLGHSETQVLLIGSAKKVDGHWARQSLLPVEVLWKPKVPALLGQTATQVLVV